METIWKEHSKNSAPFAFEANDFAFEAPWTASEANDAAFEVKRIASEAIPCAMEVEQIAFEAKGFALKVIHTAFEAIPFTSKAIRFALKVQMAKSDQLSENCTLRPAYFAGYRGREVGDLHSTCRQEPRCETLGGRQFLTAPQPSVCARTFALTKGEGCVALVQARTGVKNQAHLSFQTPPPYVQSGPEERRL